jgi:hypothetical protein
MAGLFSLDSLRPKSLDYFFALRRLISTNSTHFPCEVVVVYLDNTWPGDWRPYTDLLTNIALSATNSPKAVVFDFLFTQKGTNQTFSEFSDAVKNAAVRTKIVFATERTTNWQGKIAVKTIKQFFLEFSSLVTSVSNVTVGLADLPKDSDDVIRSYYGSDEHGYSPLAFAVAEAGTESPGGFFIDYWAPPETLLYYGSLSDLKAAYGGNFQGKVVFVGNSTVDRHKTPYARQPKTTSSGTEIHATAYLNICRGTRIRGLGGFGEGFLVLLFGVGFGWCFAKWTPRMALMIGLGCTTIVVLLAFFLFRNAHCYVPWLSIAAVMVPVAILGSVVPVQSAFVSFRSADKETAFRIAEELEKFGVEIYLDLKQKGQRGWLEHGLFPEIEKRGCFLLVVTPALLTLGAPTHQQESPDWVGEEIARALSRGKPILLVYVDDAGSRIAAQREKAVLPRYEAVYTKGYWFALESVLSGNFRSAYNLVHLASSILQIREKLPWRIRTQCGKRPSVHYESRSNV